MGRVPDCSKATEFTVHEEGGPFGFVITEVKDHATKNCPPGQQFDAFKFKLMPTQPGENRGLVFFQVPSGANSYFLKKLCEGCGFDPTGGFDIADFVGRKFIALVDHREWNGNIYANINAKSIMAITPELDGDTGNDGDDDLPF